MKKILLVLVLLLGLTACFKDPLEKIGYSKDDVTLIKSLDPAVQELFKTEYNERYLDIIKNDNFNVKKAELYFEAIDLFDINDLIEYVNAGYNLEQLKKIYALSQEKYFVKDDLAEYLSNYMGNAEDTVEYVNHQKFNNKPYVDVKEADDSKGILILVNKNNYLSSDYVPENLVEIESKYGIKAKLKSEAYEAYKKMSDAAEEDGMSFYITSPYRPYSSQERIYNSYLNSYTQKEVDTFSARPGYSEHQTGLAVDILTRNSNFGNFEYTQEAKWLLDNAYKYGFILRYPKDKEDITGYTYEPWHYRYVGDIAEDVYNSGLTYDEYYYYYIEH